MPREAAKTLDQVEQEIKEKESPLTNRKLVVERDDYGLYYVKQNGGGKIPDMLKGKFTSMMVVQDLIDKYESR